MGCRPLTFDVDNDSADAVLRCFGEVVEAGTVGRLFLSPVKWPPTLGKVSGLPIAAVKS